MVDALRLIDTTSNYGPDVWARPMEARETNKASEKAMRMDAPHTETRSLSVASIDDVANRVAVANSSYCEEPLITTNADLAGETEADINAAWRLFVRHRRLICCEWIGGSSRELRAQTTP